MTNQRTWVEVYFKDTSRPQFFSSIKDVENHPNRAKITFVQEHERWEEDGWHYHRYRVVDHGE